MKRAFFVFSSILFLSILTAFTPSKMQQNSNANPIVYKLMEIGYMWNFLSEAYEPVKERDDTWLNVGLRSKYATAKKYASLEIIETTFETPVFVRGPHNGEMNFNSKTSFGYYNPAFISKLKSNIEVALKHPLFKSVIKQTYDQYFKSTALTYMDAYRFLNDNPEKLTALKTKYLLEIAKPGGTSKGSFQEEFRAYADNGYFLNDTERKEYETKNPNADWYEKVSAPSFWLRRSIDGTSQQFFELLDMIVVKME